MSLAPGGLIKQKIYADTVVNPEIYRLVSRFKVEIYDTNVYERVVGVPAPPTPVSYETYKNAGYPWYKLYDNEVLSIESKEDSLVSEQKPV